MDNGNRHGAKRVRVAPGIFRRVIQRDGQPFEQFDIRYNWRGKKITEAVPPGKNGKCTLAAAKKLKGQRQSEARIPDWVPPHRQRREQAKRTQRTQDIRAPLLFDNACALFDPKGRDGQLRTLAYYFAGRYLDEIGPLDIEEYGRHRTNLTGPFARTRKRGQKFRGKALKIPYPSRQGNPCWKNARNECHRLSALWWYMERWTETQRRAGYVVEDLPKNPVLLADKRGWNYTPAHRPYLPTKAEVRALLDAAPSRLFRAFVALAYYTGARPRSETWAVRHGDFDLPDPGKVTGIDGSPAWGRVRFGSLGMARQQAKTASGNREVLLHPEAVALLRDVVNPDTPEDRLFIGARGRWLPEGYRTPWDATLRRAVQATGNEEMGRRLWLRDFRKLLNTRVVNAGLTDKLVKKTLGHKGGNDMTTTYFEAEEREVQKALSALTLGPTDTAPDTAQQTADGTRA